MSLIYYNNEDKKDLRKFEGMDEDYEEDNDSGEDEGEEDSQEDSGQGGMPGKGGFGKGAAGFLGKAGKTIQKVGKVISMLPLPVRLFVFTLLAGLITYLVMEINTTEASAATTSSVSSTVSDMRSEAESGKVVAEDGTVIELTEEEKEAKLKAVEFYEDNNSYLYFNIGDINKAYDNFIKDFKGSTGDIDTRLYKSFSTQYGSTELDETTYTQRIVNPDQKLPLYIHLLMTEKYNFNAVNWKWYGHAHSGEDIPAASMTEDKNLGLVYPNDGNTKIDTFIELLSPYMLTWHIPLGFHSGFITKSGDDSALSKITYSVIKNTYSKIVAHRYDVQKRTTETKYDEYTESVYTSDVDVKVEVTYEYRPIIEGVKELEITQTGMRDDSTGAFAYKWADASGRKDLYIYTGSYATTHPAYSFAVGKIPEDGKLITSGELDMIMSSLKGSDEHNYDYSSDLNYTFKDVVEDGTYSAVLYEFKQVDTSISSELKRIVATKTVYTYDIKVKNYGVPKTDSAGNILYDLYARYMYRDTIVNDPNLQSTKEVNTRLTEDGKVDPMLENQIDNVVTITNKYYVQQADTFDVKIENNFNYIKYNESDANNRRNAKTEMQYDLQDYKVTLNEENKVTNENKNTFFGGSTSLVTLESTFNIASGNDIDKYDSVKNITPGSFSKIESGVTLPSDLTEDGENIVPKKTNHVLNYEGKNTYTDKIGLAEDGKGTHYILRVWEDTLTQRSTNTTTYTTEDLIEYNAEHNAEINGTSVETEKGAYETLVHTGSSTTNYSQYKALAVQKLLNTIYFMNSNKDMFDKYLVSDSPQSKIMGYNKSYIEFAMDEVERLFKETEKENGTIPYLYGVSLGFTNILTESSTRKINASSRRFIWPIPEYEYVSYIFGYSNAYSGGTYSSPGSYGLHTGIDLSIGDVEVLATADGTVIGCVDTIADGTYIPNSYGNYVLIEHADGYATLYSHLANDVKVFVGEEVKQGDVIGITNTTGSSTGKHLHYEIRQSGDGEVKFADSGVASAFDYYSELVDPLEFYVVEPANGNTIEYDELLLNPALGEQITMQDAYKFVGYIGLGVADEEFITMLHSWEGGEGGMTEIDGVMCYEVKDVVGNPTVGHGIDLKTSGYLDRFIAAGYLEAGVELSSYVGKYVPVEFVDSIEQEQILEKEEAIRTKLAGIELEDYQMQAMVSRAYNCGAHGATKEREGLNFVEAYNKYWVGNETTEIDFEHPFFVNYMGMPDTSNGEKLLGLQRRRRAEWILFVTGTPANNGDDRIGI